MVLSTLEIVLYFKNIYLHYWKVANILLKDLSFVEIKYSQAMSKEIVLHCPHKNIYSTIDFIIFIFIR